MNSRITFRSMLAASVLSMALFTAPSLGAGNNSSSSPSSSSSSGFSRPSVSSPAPSSPRVATPTPSAPVTAAPSNNGFSRPSSSQPVTTASPPAVSTPSAPKLPSAPAGALAGAAAGAGAAAAYQSYQSDRAPTPVQREEQRAATPSYTGPSTATTPRSEARTVMERETIYVPSSPQVIYVPTPGYQPAPIMASRPTHTSSVGSSWTWLIWLLGLGTLGVAGFLVFSMLRNR